MGQVADRAARRVPVHQLLSEPRRHLGGDPGECPLGVPPTKRLHPDLGETQRPMQKAPLQVYRLDPGSRDHAALPEEEAPLDDEAVRSEPVAQKTQLHPAHHEEGREDRHGPPSVGSGHQGKPDESYQKATSLQEEHAPGQASARIVRRKAHLGKVPRGKVLWGEVPRGKVPRGKVLRGKALCCVGMRAVRLHRLPPMPPGPASRAGLPPLQPGARG